MLAVNCERLLLHCYFFRYRNLQTMAELSRCHLPWKRTQAISIKDLLESSEIPLDVKSIQCHIPNMKFFL